MKRFIAEDAGVTSIEYALMAGFIAAVIASAIPPIGNSLNIIFAAAAAGLS